MPHGSLGEFTLESTAFGPGEEIPPRFTCEGEDLAPPLAWHGFPQSTRSFVLIVDDPDAPDPAAPERTYVHWVAYDIPAGVTSLPEGGELPQEARAGKNDWGRLGFGGPCPPVGQHRYVHKLYALDDFLDLPPGATKAEVVAAMEDHLLAKAELVGVYEKRAA